MSKRDDVGRGTKPGLDPDRTIVGDLTLSSDRSGATARRPAPDTLADRACHELIERWRQGDRVSVETLCSKWPEGLLDGDALFELVYTEYLIREEHGDQAVESLAARFPGLAERLRRQVALHRALGESTDVGSSVLSAIATRLTSGGSVFGPTEFDSASSVPTISPISPSVAGYEVKRLLGKGGMGVSFMRPGRSGSTGPSPSR